MRLISAPDEIRHRTPLRRLRKGRATSHGVRSGLRARPGWPDLFEKINGPFLFGDKGTPAEYSAGLEVAISRGWLVMHESGTYVKFTPSGAELFA
jgi:hypothetical protein